MMLEGHGLISRERLRQVAVVGWDSDHDDKHTDGSLAKAAAIYAIVEQENVIRILENYGISGLDWPWDMNWFKPFSEPPTNDPFYSTSFPAVDRIRCLVKAGALIAAEIDRLQRCESD